jgi:hypothetical protein
LEVRVARLRNDEPVKDRNNPVNFTAPMDQVRENVSTYSDRVRRSKTQAGALKGKGKPLGGAPPIPAGKMAKITMQRPVFEKDQPKPEVKKPPVGGVGSAYKINQRMASGEVDGPVSIAEAKEQNSRFSEQTEEAIRAMDRNVREASQEFVEEEMPEDTFPDQSDDDQDDRDELERADKELERASFDMEGLIRARNSLLSDERRVAIEKRLKQLDISDMVTKREIQQKVPVVPGRLEFTFRTLSQNENIFCLRYVYEFPGSEAYANEMLNTAKLVCSIVAINDAMLHNHMRDREVDRDEFQNKWDQVVSFPVQMVGDMSVQLIWFNNRVNKLFDIGNLKNG